MKRLPPLAQRLHGDFELVVEAEELSVEEREALATGKSPTRSPDDIELEL